MDYRFILPRRPKKFYLTAAMMAFGESMAMQPLEYETMPVTDFSTVESQNGLKALLRTMPLYVTFKKADGTIRDMYCTLHPEWIEDWKPAQKRTEDDDPFPEDRKAKYAHVCQVFDLEKRAWRSFRWDSITGISTLRG